MSKSSRERALAENEAKSVARMLRVSPQKLNLVAQLIRGKKVATALADLEFSRKRIARDVRKRSPTPKTTRTARSTIWSSPRRVSARRS